MIYLIGGPPRCGKSTLAKMMLDKIKAPYISTDSLVHMLKKAAPQLGINDKVELTNRAELFYPFLYQFVKLASYDPSGYIVEGDVVWPKQVSELSSKFEVKAVFLGFEAITLRDIMDNIGANDWMKDISEEQRNGMPAWLKSLSLKFADECKIHGFKYIDLSGDFRGKLEEAQNYLLA